MKKYKRFIALMLCLLLSFSMITIAFADDTGTDTGDGTTEETATIPVYSTRSEALDALRESMVEREAKFSFQITKALVEEITGQAYDSTSVSQQSDVQAWLDDLADEALIKHTGDPLEGDSLFYHCKMASMIPAVDPTVSTATTAGYILTVTEVWYTDNSQEAALSDAVTDIVDNQLGLDESSDDMAKAEAIYTYLTSSVTCTEDYVDIDFTAYGALVNNKAESLGTALAFYRLALTVGLDARVVSNSDEQYYNIVKIGGCYYCLEASDEFGDPVSFCTIEEFAEKGYEWDDDEMRAAYPFSDYSYSNIRGDVNGDGVVNLLDLLILKEYLAGDSNIKIPAGAADINKDSAINLMDLLELKQQLANA